MKSYSRIVALIYVGLVLLNGFTSFGEQINIITPPGILGTEGDTYAAHPELAYRFQQVFDASYFSSLPSGGGWIQLVSFRQDSGQPESYGTVHDTQISFSTTTKDANSLSPVFDNNVGSDSAIFFSRGRSELLFSGSQHDRGISSFGTFFFADGRTPDRGFFYDPAKGNLLMDIQGFSIRLGSDRSTYLFFDEITLPGHTTVRSHFPGGMEEGVLSSLSLPVIFQIAPVPEPSAFAIIGLAAIVGYGLKRTH